jgi:hypothetical protein
VKSQAAAGVLFTSLHIVSFTAVATTCAADAVDRVTRSFTVSSGISVRIDATIATVTIVGSNRPDIQVEVVRRAPSASDFAKYPAVIDQIADALHIRSVQADEGRDANLKTEITVRSPATVPFNPIRVFEGRVTLTNVRSGCDVDLRRGAIEATGVAGRVRLESGLGSIDVRDSELSPDGMMRLRVFNGPVRVRFRRAPANARILAVTFNGTIASDIPLTKKDQFGPRFSEATLGSGEPVLSIDVVTGDIRITLNR